MPLNPRQVAVLFKLIPLKVTKAKAVRAMPKSGIAAQVAESTGLKKSEVTQILSSLADVGAAEVKKTGAWSSPSGCVPLSGVSGCFKGIHDFDLMFPEMLRR